MKLQQLAEEKVGVLIVFTLLVVSVGLLIEAVPLFFSKAVTQPIEGVKPYNALQVAGRDIYVREGCYNCHSQMIRPFRAELNVTATTPLPVSLFMTIRSNGVLNVPVRIWLVSAAVIPMNGTASTC